MLFKFANKYFYQLTETLNSMDYTSIFNTIRDMQTVYNKHANLFIFGNGGSASTASHFTNDLQKGVVSLNAKQTFKVMCLNDNIPLMTAWANDNGYKTIFKKQLEPFIASDDMAIGISVSGMSLNVVEALNYARLHGAKTTILTGSKGIIKSMDNNNVISVPSDDIQIVEDAHLAICHCMYRYLRANVQGKDAYNSLH